MDDSGRLFRLVAHLPVRQSSGRLVVQAEDVSLADAPSRVLCSTEISIPENADAAVPVALNLPRSLTEDSELVVTARLLLHKDNDLRRGDCVTMVSYSLPKRDSKLDLHLQQI